MQGQPSKAPRRTKTKAPGVYRSVSGRYEIAFRDSDGRLRFKVVAGGFEAAKAERAELVGKIRKGETVRPSKQTFAEFAETWLASINHKPRTVEAYRYALSRHLLPRFRRYRLAEITVDEVAKLVTAMQKDGYSGSTVNGALTVLSAMLRKAARMGLVSVNPVSKLDRGERPRIARKEKRILTGDEIAALLKAAGRYRALVAVLLFSGLRISEALGLVWEDIDFDGGFIRVRKQLSRERERVEPKTLTSKRDIVLVEQLAKILREHRMASRFKGTEDFLFPAPDGRGREHSSAGHGIARAVEKAKLGEGITPHTFRHTYASMLVVGLKLDPVRVAAQLGDTIETTLNVYTHLFEQARHADELRNALGDGFGHLLTVNAMSTSGRNPAQAAAGGTAQPSRMSG